MRGLLVTLCCVAALGALVGTTLSAFSDEASNGGNSFQAASTFPCSSPGTQTVVANADSYVREDQATTNYGNSTALEVFSRNNQRNRRALVTFSLPATPSNCTLTGATLRLNASSATVGRTLEARRLTSAWTEGGVTWTNLPPSTTTGMATTTSAGGWRQWSVAAQVQAMYAGTNHGFLVRDATEDAAGNGQLQEFSSRTGANPPQLVLTFG